MKKGLIIKVIVIIIIQALLLTQADFAFAAIFSGKELTKEAALKYQSIYIQAMSLIKGIANVYQNSLQNEFTLIGGSNLFITELVSREKPCLVSKVFYKDIILTNDNVVSQKILLGFTSNNICFTLDFELVVELSSPQKGYRFMY